MKEDLLLQCFICKKSISGEESKLDPCAVSISSNVDKDALDQKSQTFFCHYECFRKIHNDDGTLYLESLETQREMDEENNNISNNLFDFTDLLYHSAKTSGIWENLFKLSPGKWHPLKSVIDVHQELQIEINQLEEKCEPLLIQWTDDLSSEQRSHNRLWKVVLIATESYEFPTSLLIDLDLDFFRNLEK